jgi:hypothetical protein
MLRQSACLTRFNLEGTSVGKFQFEHGAVTTIQLLFLPTVTPMRRRSWERSENEESADLCGRLDMPERAPVDAAAAAIQALDAPHVLAHVRGWIIMQRNALGREEVTRGETRPYAHGSHSTALFVPRISGRGRPCVSLSCCGRA